MTETKFTRGPWKYKKGRKSHHEWGHLFTAKRGKVFLFGCEGLSDADSHLIASAPDLYNALENVMYEIQFLGDEEHYFGTTERFDAARAALAKARGES